MAFTDSPATALATFLAADLAQVLGRAVDPRDFGPRLDGAVAPVIGHLATASPRHRRTACRLLEEWVSAGSAERGKSPGSEGPAELDLATLVVDGHTLFPGLRIEPLPGGLPPQEVLRRSQQTAATLVGGMAEVVLVEPGQGAERAPGWLARLRMLARWDELDARDTTARDPGGWVVAAHEAVSSVHVPGAAAGSLWSDLLQQMETQALAALDALGETAEGDLYRRDDAFTGVVDIKLSAVLHDHTPGDGSVLQVVRLPRRRDGRTLRGAVLFAPGVPS